MRQMRTNVLPSIMVVLLPSHGELGQGMGMGRWIVASLLCCLPGSLGGRLPVAKWLAELAAEWILEKILRTASQTASILSHRSNNALVVRVAHNAR